ncbi:beta strand repeat-containing protein [Methanobrevibacter sp.]|uniref:beta strand repeat-containing protein n=1 Tax=Methanobrevibacter sp. TaxID=66852 RepID=UPI00386FD48C
MQNKKIIMLVIFLVGLLAVGAASAADVAGLDNTTNAIGTESNSDSTLSATDDNDNLEVSLDDNLKNGVSTQKSFRDLNDTINGVNQGDKINLTENYIYDSTKDADFNRGILIDRNVTIYGNGITIDGAKTVKIFDVAHGNIVFCGITFINGNSTTGGGAIFGNTICNVTVINCTFANNWADLHGGAIAYVRAINCTFTSNSAGVDGGAMVDGSAINCTFTNNYAGRSGGAMQDSSAVNCIFSSNYAKVCGGAMSEGNAINCTFLLNYRIIPSSENPNYYDTTCKNCVEYNSAAFSFSGSIFDSRLLFDAKDDSGRVLNGVYTKVHVKNQTFEADYYALSGEGWPIEVAPGTYEITLSNSHPNVHSATQNVTLAYGTTFLDLNIVINGNAANEIILDKDYTFNPATDSAFINGILIDRKITVRGNGHTINADGKARIFNVASNDVVFKDITFKGGYADEGGAIYWSSTNANILNCCFVNNTAKNRAGAIYFKNEMSNVNIIGNYSHNTAKNTGGANYFGNDVTNANIIGNYYNNTADNGGANFFGSQLININITGNYSYNIAQYGCGGANYFNNSLVRNVNITGNYSYNKAGRFGGANYFSDTLIDVIIIGNYYNNKAECGGANYFSYQVTDVNIIGNYFNNTVINNGGANYFEIYTKNLNIIGEYSHNKAENGGANYFNQQLTNAHISGNYFNNAATIAGGANYFDNDVTNANIIGNYYNNTAKNGNGGANYFKTPTYTNITGNYINNTGSSIIYMQSSQNNIIKDSIFLNNQESNIKVVQGEIQITNNWFGNNASNKDVDIAKIDGATAVNWYFLDIEFTPILATVSLDKLYSNGAVIVDSNFKLPDINMTLTGKNMDVPNTKTLEKGFLTISIDHETQDMTLTASYNVASYTKTAQFGEFYLLQFLIERSGPNCVINLNKSYTYTKGYDTMTEGILINYNNVTINGNGHTINATGKTRIFKITGSDVTLNDITFTEGYTADDGGAIHWSGSNPNILNCYFVNNTAKEGGANYFYKELDFSNINATFINNTATEHGGANYFFYGLTNVRITGNFINNKAIGSGANEFEKPLTNVSIIGNFINNKANGAGANSFKELNNVNIIGNYTDNTANLLAGANYFDQQLTNVNIIGNYNHNKGGQLGGANYFTKSLVNVNITGNYNDNTASTLGGANHFIQTLTNVNIIGNYSDNTAFYGGANNFRNNLINVAIIGSYINNKADNGGANNFEKTLENVTITGNYIRNSGSNVIYISNSSQNNVIRDSVFINNNAINIGIANGNINVINNWFGNNASNYDSNITNVRGVEVDNWLFLDAAANPSSFSFIESTNITFKLYLYNQSAPTTISVYDNTLIQPIELSLTKTNGEINQDSVSLDEAVRYAPNSDGKGSVNATFENVKSSIEFDILKIDPEIFIEDIAGSFGETVNVKVIIEGGDAKGNIIHDGVLYSVENGCAVVPLVISEVGMQSFSITYSGDDKYLNESVDKGFIAGKGASSIAINGSAKINVGDILTVTVTVEPNVATGNVIITLDGNDYAAVTLNNSVATVEISGLKNGIHAVTAIYSGNSKYKSAEASVNVTVNKINTKLSAKAITATYNINKYLVVVLKDVNGNPIKGAKVSVNLGATKTYKTNSKGQIKIPTKSLVPKKYTAKVTFKGTAIYASSTAKVKVVVKKASSKLSAKKKTFKVKTKNKKFYAVLKNSKGKAIKKAKVYIKVKGKKYSKYTNKKGVATFNLKLSKGKYVVGVGFAGNKYYKKAKTVKTTVTVKAN